MDLDNCKYMRLIRNQDDGRYNLMVKNTIVPSVIMPDRLLTNVSNMDKWIYDLNAPEPDLASQMN